MMKDLLMWKPPHLNYALRYLYLHYSGLLGLTKFCLYLLERANSSAIIFYMPQLIQSIRTNTNHMVEKYILKKSKNYSVIAHQFIWSLEVEEISKYVY